MSNIIVFNAFNLILIYLFDFNILYLMSNIIVFNAFNLILIVFIVKYSKIHGKKLTIY